MNTRRNSLRTGLLVLITVGAFVGLVVYLASPGTIVRQNTYWVYFDNAAGIKPGAQVLLAGRKIGQVRRLYSPVPKLERPSPKLETLIEVQVTASAQVYKKVQVWLSQPRLLAEPVIDFTNGEESSGLAPNGFRFKGQRPPGISETVPIILERLDPVIEELSTSLASLREATDNFTRLSDDDADLPKAFSEFRELGVRLNKISSEEGPLHQSLANLEHLTGPGGKLDVATDQLAGLTAPGGHLSQAFANAERFTASLSKNPDLDVTLRNFRSASGRLNNTVGALGSQFSTVGSNLAQASDTIKRQPWRLIWPSTKKYGDEAPRGALLSRPPLPAKTPAPRDASKRLSKPPSPSQKASDSKKVRAPR